jgi:two-component system phosphate regulon response regulator PhoB
MATARGAETDKIRGLNLGADNYGTKPLRLPELMARIEAALRRAATAPTERPNRLQHRDLVADLDEHHMYARNMEVHLTPTEFRLLVCLLEHRLASRRLAICAGIPVCAASGA